MESILGRGYSINEEADLVDQYSPLSSTIDEDIEQDDDLFYTEEDNAEEEEDSSSTVPTSHGTHSTSSIDEISGMGLGKKQKKFSFLKTNDFIYLFSKSKVHLNHHHLK